MSDIPEEHKIDAETVVEYIDHLRKIVEKSQRLEYGPGWQGPYGAVDMNEEQTSSEKLNDAIEDWVDSLPDAEQQLIYAKRRAKLLEEGPGGIMEMKQTIADKEATIYALESQIGLMKNYADAIDEENERLQKYRNLVHFIANDYYELSYEKTQWQRDDWKKRCLKLRDKLEYGNEQA